MSQDLGPDELKSMWLAEAERSRSRSPKSPKKKPSRRLQTKATQGAKTQGEFLGRPAALPLVPPAVFDLENELFEISGLCKGVNKYSKLVVCCREIPEHLQKINDLAVEAKCALKVPMQKFDKGPQELYFIRISLGAFKYDKTLFDELKEREGKPITVRVMQKSYASADFGAGIYLLYDRHD